MRFPCGSYLSSVLKNSCFTPMESGAFCSLDFQEKRWILPRKSLNFLIIFTDCSTSSHQSCKDEGGLLSRNSFFQLEFVIRNVLNFLIIMKFPQVSFAQSPTINRQNNNIILHFPGAFKSWYHQACEVHKFFIYWNQVNCQRVLIYILKKIKL
jgi:hypothetical protein